MGFECGVCLECLSIDKQFINQCSCKNYICNACSTHLPSQHCPFCRAPIAIENHKDFDASLSPNNGDQWVNLDFGQLYIYHNDTWVEVEEFFRLRQLVE